MMHDTVRDLTKLENAAARERKLVTDELRLIYLYLSSTS
jgi:hypothetical protein